MEIRPQAPKNGLQISLLTSPQPPTDIKFKSSYARKHIIKKVESRTQLLNPEQGETSPSLKGSMTTSEVTITGYMILSKKVKYLVVFENCYTIIIIIAGVQQLNTDRL